MPRRLSLPADLLAHAARQERLVSTAQCVASGMTRDRVARLVQTGRWWRITRGVYDTSTEPVRERPLGHRRLRAAWAALLAFGPEAIAVGPCALALWEVDGLPIRVVPQAALPKARRTTSRDGVLLRQFDDGMTVTRRKGRWVATPDWALAQAVPELDREHAVSLMDSTMHRELLTPRDLVRAHDLARGRRGVARTHAWWEEADGRADSPLETRARLACVDDGVPPDALQVGIVDVDGVERWGDLGWRLGDGRWLLAELDGREVHDTPSAAFEDRARQNAMVSGGRVSMLRFTGADVAVDEIRGRRRVLTDTVRTALANLAPNRDLVAGRAGTSSGNGAVIPDEVPVRHRRGGAMSQGERRRGSTTQGSHRSRPSTRTPGAAESSVNPRWR